MITRELIARLARGVDTTMSRAFLRAVGLPAPEPRAQPAPRPRRSVYDGWEECFENKTPRPL